MTNTSPAEDLLALIPAWARWIAQDKDGTWWAFEAEPNLASISWYENEVGRYFRLKQSPVVGDWRESLKLVKKD